MQTMKTPKIRIEISTQVTETSGVYITAYRSPIGYEYSFDLKNKLFTVCGETYGDALNMLRSNLNVKRLIITNSKLNQ